CSNKRLTLIVIPQYFLCYNLRNCSCYTLVRDCEEALANSQCRCYTDRRSALPHARIREHGLTLLNMSMVDHLCLSFCGIKPIGTQNLALLRTLRIHNAAPEVPFPIQEISISPAAGLTVEFKALSFDFSSSIHVTILDTAALNGLSTLKTYSIVGPTDVVNTTNCNLSSSLSFPLPLSFPSSYNSLDPSEQAAEPLQNLLITFVY
uniref:Uncharacterized protein n=1 Tax=Anabas testudineus TaxID=64144 RepID=A0A3Q1HPD3_ANATE